jgi:hypothetical protein
MANSPSYPKQDLVPNLIKNVSKKLPKWNVIIKGKCLIGEAEKTNNGCCTPCSAG